MKQFPYLETQRLRARGYGPRVYRLMLWRQTTLIRLSQSPWLPRFIQARALKMFDSIEGVLERRPPCV